MNRTNMIKTVNNSQNLNKLNRSLCGQCTTTTTTTCCGSCTSRWISLRAPVVKRALVCLIRIRQSSHRRDRLWLQLKLIALAIFSLILLSNNQHHSRTYLASGQEIAEVNSSGHQQGADDDELGKTLDRPSEEETRGGSTVLQTETNPTSQTGHDELDERDREHSMSIWLPDEHHRLTSEEDLDQFAIQKQRQYEDEELAGASELNHQFISVLNNQSNIVFSNPVNDNNNNNNNNTSGNQNKQQQQMSTHNQQQPFATSFLLGNDNSKTNETRTVLSVNWKQSHQVNGDNWQQHGSHLNQNVGDLAGSQLEPNNTAQGEFMGESIISNKADQQQQQQSIPVQSKQDSRKKKKRKKKVHKKIINNEVESHLQVSSGGAQLTNGPAKMISYRPKGAAETMSQTARVSPNLSNSSRLQVVDENQSFKMAQQQLVVMQLAAGRQLPKESLATLGSSTSGRLIVPGARLSMQPQQQQQQLSPAPDLLPQMSYLDASTTSSSIPGPPASSAIQSGPFEFKKLARGGDKQVLLNEYLMASGSHAANEFETTLKQQPQQQQEPIVTHSDSGGSSSGLDAHGGLESTSSSSILTPSDLSDDDDDGDPDSFESTGGSNKNEPMQNQHDHDEMDEHQVRDNKQQPQQTKQQQQLRAKANKDNQQVGGEQNQNQNQPQQQSLSNLSGPSGGSPGQVRELEHELLVGPFKSESEAPATITLSGVVYQKSGSSSSFLETRPPAIESGSDQPHLQRDKLSASGSKLSFNGQQALTGGAQVNKPLADGALQQQPSGDKYTTTTAWLQSQPAPSQLAASINEILLNLVKGNQDSQLAISHGGSLDPSTSGMLNQLSNELPTSGGLVGSGSSGNGATGGLRIAAFGPLSSASSLLSNSILGGSSSSAAAAGNQFPSSQLDELLLGVNSAPKLISSNQLKAAAAGQLDLSGLSGSSSSLESGATSLTPGEQVWTNKMKVGDKYYLGSSLSAAASDNHHHHHHSKHKDKGPIVIVQKDVKPVKYHLMRAYLKLRRLLRPFEATYVFLNDSQTNGYSVGRRHRRSSGGSRPAPPTPLLAAMAHQLTSGGHLQRSQVVQQQQQQQQQQSNGQPMPNAVSSSSAH